MYASSDLVKLSDDVIRTRINFTNRVIPTWNSLSNHVVSADTVNCFKNCLDKFSSNQEVLYNHKADLHGIGNRSTLCLKKKTRHQTLAHNFPKC